ncbi:IS3 family transposase [Sinorhizobium meliloti]|uniref:IS3 family transposase n=1 Tax=Rhizobium meliloti TaxID=382 RepID=UPI002090E79D|nr:IS3 family transposase [Sinorhizobium meliloti]MCO5966612.1 IS3 family transposase [Sinorhizobium meliloti]
MGIARSTYYDRPERPADDAAIVEAMFTICDEFEFYGYRRVGAALRQQGLVVNPRRFAASCANTICSRKSGGGSSPRPTAIKIARSSRSWQGT